MGMPTKTTSGSKSEMGSKERAAAVRDITVFAPGGVSGAPPVAQENPAKKSGGAFAQTKGKTGTALTTGLADVARKTLLGQ